jgi:hypothetical protein
LKTSGCLFQESVAINSQLYTFQSNHIESVQNGQQLRGILKKFHILSFKLFLLKYLNIKIICSSSLFKDTLSQSDTPNAKL